MTHSLSKTLLWRAWIILSALVLPALAQITQDHPELCGKPNSYMPVPVNITAISTELESNLTIHLNNSTVNIRMGGVEKVQEVCPLDRDRFLVFGLLHDPNAHVIYLIDGRSGAELDSFTVSNPAVSPDQHWLAVREWEPSYVDPPSSVQYYLYDLTKDADGNKFPGVDYRYVPHLGRTIFPATPKHLPFENDQPSDQRHHFEGGSFQWAADSKSLVFLDRTAAGLALVLIRIGPDDLTTYMHRLGSGACASTLSRADFGSAHSSAPPDVRIEFADSCPPVFLQARDFKPAPLEVHKPIKRRPSVRDDR
jgi:hypothetical protein